MASGFHRHGADMQLQLEPDDIVSLIDTAAGPVAWIGNRESIATVFVGFADLTSLRAAIQVSPWGAEVESRQWTSGARQRVSTALRSFLAGKADELAELRVRLDHLTPWQKQVLQETRRIPAGETCTYGELARQLGRPQAARAVGQALGKNPVPLLIPCHRVVGAAGLGGFTNSGGLRLKNWLIDLDARISTSHSSGPDRNALGSRTPRKAAGDASS